VAGLLTCSGFVTSITILLIVVFLFTEAFGLFKSKVIEDGYVLALNKANLLTGLARLKLRTSSMKKLLTGKKLEVLMPQSKYSDSKILTNIIQRKN
jgi:phosphate transport system permease protein